MPPMDGIDPADDYVDSLKDFMNQNVMAVVYEHLQDQLWERKVSHQNPVFGNIFSCQKAHFISREEGCIHMQTEFKNISEEKITSLAKQKIIIPEILNDGKHMLNVFAATCAELFRDKFMGILELKKMLNFINGNENTFKEWQLDGNIFMTQWLYVIKCGWQQFLVRAKEGKIDLSTMC
eukprot:14897104-Ditylum_brightwellii.AAC.1